MTKISFNSFQPALISLSVGLAPKTYAPLASAVAVSLSTLNFPSGAPLAPAIRRMFEPPVQGVSELIHFGCNRALHIGARTIALRKAAQMISGSVAFAIDVALALDRVHAVLQKADRIDVINMLFRDLSDGVLVELHRRAEFDYLSAKTLLYAAQANAKTRRLASTMSIEPFRTLLPQVDYWLHADDRISMDGGPVPRFLVELSRLAGTFENRDAQELLLSFDLSPIIEQAKLEDHDEAQIAIDVLSFLALIGHQGACWALDDSAPRALLEQRIEFLASDQGTAEERRRLYAKARRQLVGSPDLLLHAANLVAAIDTRRALERKRGSEYPSLNTLLFELFRNVDASDLMPLYERAHSESDFFASRAIVVIALTGNRSARDFARRMSVASYEANLADPKSLMDLSYGLAMTRSVVVPQPLVALSYLAELLTNSSAQQVLDRVRLQTIGEMLQEDESRHKLDYFSSLRTGKFSQVERLFNILYFFAEEGLPEAIVLLEEKTPSFLAEMKREFLEALSQDAVERVKRLAKMPLFGELARRALSYLSLAGHPDVPLASLVVAAEQAPPMIRVFGSRERN